MALVYEWALKKMNRRIIPSILLILAILLHPISAFAVSEQRLNIERFPTYDKTAEGQSCSSSTGGISNPLIPTNLSNNAQIAFYYLVQKGLTPPQAAGAVGNMLAESSVDPTKIQGGKHSQNPADAGSGGWGIIQWTPGSKVIGIAQNAGITTPIYELSTQLEIVWWHMGNVSPTGVRNMLAKYRTITDVDVAAVTYEEQMEGASVKVLEKRKALARQVLLKYGGDAVSPDQPLFPTLPPTPDSNCISDGSSTTGVGGGGTVLSLENLTYYSQCDSAWGGKAYGPSTICKSGCGPTAMAMVISTLTSQRITPDVIANYSYSRGYYDGNGTKWGLMTDAPKNYNLKAVDNGKDINAVQATIAAGGLVIASMGPGHFTDGGHFIVIRGVDSNGKILVADPNDGQPGNPNYLRKTKTAWDANIVISEAKNFWSITK